MEHVKTGKYLQIALHAMLMIPHGRYATKHEQKAGPAPPPDDYYIRFRVHELCSSALRSCGGGSKSCSIDWKL